MEEINKILKDNNIIPYHCIMEENNLVIELIDKSKVRVCQEESMEFFSITKILNSLDIKYQIYGYKRIKL